MNQGQKFCLDFGPLLLFFGAYYGGGIFWATGAFMAVMPIVMFLYWKIEGRIPTNVLITAAVVLVFGGLTIGLQDDRFIKVKPTLVYTTFAVILFSGLATGRSFLRHVFEAAMPPLDTEGWRKLTFRWACFFAVMAVINEVIWRNFSEEFWVNFKLFGFLPITFAFAMAQVSLMSRHKPKEDY